MSGTRYNRREQSTTCIITRTVQTYHTCGCRDNPQQQMAPRRRGSWAPSLLCTDATHAVSRAPLAVAVRSRSLWFASQGVLSQPPASLGRFLGRRPFLRSAIARWQEATDPQSPEEVVSGPANTEGAHRTASGRRAMAVRTQPLRDASPGTESSPFRMVLEWSVLGSPPFSTRTVALLTQSYPAVLEATLSQRGWNINTYPTISWVSSSTPGGVERTTSLPRDSVRRDAHEPARPSRSGTHTPWP